MSPREISEFLADAPCGLAVTDPDGRLIFVNGTLMKWLGRPDLLEGQPPLLSELLTIPGRIYYETHLAPMLKLQGFVREIACHLALADGGSLPVLLNGVARSDADGNLTRIEFSLNDSRERSAYEKVLREARRKAEELAAIVRSSPSAIIRTDPEGLVRSWNAAAERLTGIQSKTALGSRLVDVLELADDPQWFEREFRNIPDDQEHVFEAVIGDARDVEISLTYIGAENSGDDGPDVSVIVRDISLRKAADRHRELLVNEMDHRIKNVLSVVHAIARQTVSGAEGDAFSARLRALSKAHDLLIRSSWGVVDLADILQVTADEAGGDKRLSFSGPEVLFSSRQAASFSMVLHELVTNALKYGALSNNDGQIKVRYELAGQEAQRFSLEWREEGGPPVVAPTRTGFGSTMIETVFAQEFGAEISRDFRSGGLVCQMAFDYSPPE